ncbi:dihydrofolate reductase family protein [Plantactinospora sp. WMMB782]|uniref:dihydrofolate reductase family protein n=1 Tax=Plantactinospora sp. WMMB782 TaxID=3404121 RepID=UPI003B956F12
MRELTVDLFSTVDGWLRGRDSPAFFGYDGPDLRAWIDEQSDRPQVMLMGANTYRALVEMGGGQPSDPLARLPKMVFSKSLRPPLAWPGTSLVAEAVEVAVPALKDAPGDPLRVIGSRSLVRSLFRLGLVDRLRLMVFPQVLGESGEERMLAGLPDLDLRLAATEVFDKRLVLLDYRLDRAPEPAG